MDVHISKHLQYLVEKSIINMKLTFVRILFFCFTEIFAGGLKDIADSETLAPDYVKWVNK